MNDEDSLEKESDPVVFEKEVVLNAQFWCRDCGNQFVGPFHVHRKSMASGKTELTFSEAACSNCGEDDTSVRVVSKKPGDKTTYRERMKKVEDMLDEKRIKVIGREYRGHYISALAKIMSESKDVKAGPPDDASEIIQLLGISPTTANKLKGLK